GSSSRMTNWLNWMPYAGWKAEIRKTSGAISLTFALIVLLSQLGRRAAARPVDRAHEPDVVGVRVLDDSVARAPERVVRRLAARVAGGGHVRVGRVDGLARRDPEADDDAAPSRRPVRPPGVVRLRERRAVEVEAEAVREVDVDVVRPALGSPDRRVRDGDAEATVERDGRVDVARDEVEKVQHGRRRRHRFFPRIREALDAQRSGCQHATSRFASRTPVARPVRAGVNMSEPLTPAKIIELGRGFMGSKALLAAGKLRLFDALRDGPLTAAEIRKRLELHPRAVPDFVDALVALGMLAREGDGPNARYANTPEGAR